MEYMLWKSLPDVPLNTPLLLYKIAYYGCIPNLLPFTSDKANFNIKKFEKDFPYFVEDDYDENNPLFCSVTCSLSGERKVEYKVNKSHLYSLYHMSNGMFLVNNLYPDNPFLPLEAIFKPEGDVIIIDTEDYKEVVNYWETFPYKGDLTFVG